MKRFWISWYSGYYADEGCTTPPFQVWISGSRGRPNDGMTDEQHAHYLAIEDADEADEYYEKHAKDTATICALVDAESEDDIWPVVAKHFPDYQQRFCEEPGAGWTPSDRFGNFENKTSLI